MKIDAMNETVVKAMFETVPLELTVIDANDKVVGWNRHRNRLFYRPEACMGMDFRECHPQKSLGLVEKIVGEMKAGRRNRARFWINLPLDKTKAIRHKVLIDFYALRGDDGAYLGCMECTQDVEEIMHLEGERRLVDEAE
jgi:PAS domain S-box-containing protein